MNGNGGESSGGPDQVTIEATVVHAIFSNEENGWSVLRCRDIKGVKLTAVGPLLGIQEGDRLQLSGRWVSHSKFGKQLEVRTYRQVTPATTEGIYRFLASGRVRGIGKHNARRLVDAFGTETLDVIENDPDRLTAVKGIGAKTLRRIVRSWNDYRGIQQLMIFLTGHGIEPAIAVKAYRAYGATALEVVRTNPYRLADEVFGVGFLSADRIALGLGLAPDAPERLGAGLRHCLRQASLDGHVYLPRRELLERAAGLLDCADETMLATALEQEAANGKVHLRHDQDGAPVVYQPRLAKAEQEVVRGLHRVLGARAKQPQRDVERAISWYEQRAAIELAPQQRAALAAALVEPAVVITGGPGTGKTTLVRGITRILGRQRQQVLLAAPTGRAAKRLTEATDRPAKTIHRLLELSPHEGGFQRNRSRPLKADVVVIDEVSMIDIELAAHLLEAIPRGCRLVLVGDADQLPSVGPGNVLADVISSGAVLVIRLDEIYRQARESLIVVNAHRVNNGQLPVIGSGEGLEDFYLVARDDPEAAADTVVEVVTERIPRRFHLDPIHDIQVLTPMHKGELGVSNLNQRLQEILTPPGTGEELQIGSRIMRVGDKVMQIRNNYDLEIFNGDLGRVVHIDDDEEQLTVSFDGSLVEIPRRLLDDLIPAYACTIHKSQGSEYPAVVILLHHQHHIMLQRNLLYTAITRGKQLVVIIGSRRALERAVSNATVRQRYTLLAERLRDPEGDTERSRQEQSSP